MSQRAKYLRYRSCGSDFIVRTHGHAQRTGRSTGTTEVSGNHFNSTLLVHRARKYVSGIAWRQLFRPTPQTERRIEATKPHLSLCHCCHEQRVRANSVSRLFYSCRVFSPHVVVIILAFSALIWYCWLGGWKGIRPVKNRVVGYWHGFLPGARCRLAYGPADATATHCLLLQ